MKKNIILNNQSNSRYKKRKLILYLLIIFIFMCSCENGTINIKKIENNVLDRNITTMNSASTTNSSESRTSGTQGTGLLSCTTISSLAISRGCSTTSTVRNVASTTVVNSAILPMLIGTNMTGGEMVYSSANTSNPTSGADYLFVSHQDIDYVWSKGINFIRLVFSWEGMQHKLNGVLATNNYANEMFDRVNYATSKGMYVLIEPHGAINADFAAYKGNKVGSLAVPNSAFADFWGRMATLYKSNSYVLIGLSNEPHDTPASTWFSAAQAAITAIRKAQFKNGIFVPGVGYTGAGNWTNPYIDIGDPQISNATAFVKLIDPCSNLVVSVHMYADYDSGGFDNSIDSSTVFVDRVRDVTNWAKQNNIRIHISEFAVAASNSLAQVTIDNLTKYIKDNSKTIIGGSFWAYGPPLWWGSYQFTLDPSNSYTVDSPQMKLLSGFIALIEK